jgi:uncharacterized membrane protein YkoI
MKHPTTLALFLSALALLSIPPLARADGDHERHRDRDHDRARSALLHGQILPLTEILDRVQAEAPGRFLEVELDDDDGLLIYEIKVMDDRGRITRLEVDAATGHILDRRMGGHD